MVVVAAKRAYFSATIASVENCPAKCFFVQSMACSTQPSPAEQWKHMWEPVSPYHCINAPHFQHNKQICLQIFNVHAFFPLRTSNLCIYSIELYKCKRRSEIIQERFQGEQFQYFPDCMINIPLAFKPIITYCLLNSTCDLPLLCFNSMAGFYSKMLFA